MSLPRAPFVAALLLALLGSAAGRATAQSLPKAVVVTGAPMYLSPDATSQQVGTALPGQDVGVLGHSGGFVEVFNGVSGWIPDKGDLAMLDDLQAPDTIFAAAMKLQAQAERDSGERAAAENAARLFLTLYSDFPTSIHAAEALYRGADIQWQLGMRDQPLRKSAEDRKFPDDSNLRKVESKFPGTPWAAQASFDLLQEHFTCNWNEKPDCVGKEADLFREYLKKYPASPNAAEAHYDLLYREAAGWTLFSAPGKHQDQKKADEFRRQVAPEAELIERQYKTTPWADKAADLADKVAKGKPITVNQ